MNKKYYLLYFLSSLFTVLQAETINFENFGAKKNDISNNASQAAAKLVRFLSERKDTTAVTIKFPKGRYDFYEEGTFEKEYYISNHDQNNPKKVVFPIESLKNIIFDGSGSTLMFHGTMIPFALVETKNIAIKNLSVDFPLPHLRQLNVLSVNKDQQYFDAEIVPKGDYEIKNNKITFIGENFLYTPTMAMAFDENHRLSYNRQDLSFNPSKIEKVSDNVIRVYQFQNKETKPGERFVLRSWHRPTPSVFISLAENTQLYNVKIHYANGMGLLAQMSTNITLDKFGVCLKGKKDDRYFTAQADATHFSGCRGTIKSTNGLYEGMADDAINVHGTYLKINQRINPNTIHASYMHSQTYGFTWGFAGDTVQFIESTKMEHLSQQNTIKSIRAIDKPTTLGAKTFEIEFTNPLPEEFTDNGEFGIENLTWTPKVIFSNNTVRNNRARGALFSTPKEVICENNFFDHTHGTAILLCGDCRGWFETGACRKVIIRNNRFLNALTANYQFTNAVISIYPEIHNLKEQKKYFHSGVIIENNTFETFDIPILYAKSIDGLTFKNNKIIYNQDFKPFHWNKHTFFFERVNNVLLENNHYSKPFDKSKDIRMENSEHVVVKE